MPRPRRYRGPVKLYGYLVGGPYDGCYTDDLKALIDHHTGRIHLPPPPLDDPIPLPGATEEPAYCHVYRPTDTLGRFVHDGWEAIKEAT